LALTAGNTYTGPTTINAGTLKLAGAFANNIACSPTISVNSGATLDVTGLSGGGITLAGGQTLAGNGTVAGGVVAGNGSHVAPGTTSTLGTLSVGSLTLNPGATLNYKFGLGNDLINVTSPNGLTINGGGVNLDMRGARDGLATTGTYALVNYSGTIGGAAVSPTGVALSVVDPAPGMCYGFQAKGQDVYVTISPPSTVTTTSSPPTYTPGSALRPIDTGASFPANLSLKRWNGQSWDTVTSWSGNGINPSEPTVVLVHGWITADSVGANDPFSLSGGAQTLTQIAQQLYTQDPSANVLAWDWRTQAVSHPGQPLLSTVDDIMQERLSGAAASAARGEVQGVMLANELTALGIQHNNLQLIGHSNGAMVVGKAAQVLAANGQPVERVTTLDAPDANLLGTRVNAMRDLVPATASQFEVYYSDHWLSLGFGQPLLGASNIFNGEIYPGPAVPSTNCDHLRVLSWYPAGTGTGDAAINWSILSPNASSFTPGNFAETALGSHSFTSLAPQPEPFPTPLTPVSVENFKDGTNLQGQHASVVVQDAQHAFAQITSGSDGYLYSAITVPPNVSYLTYDLNVESPLAGDFLTVSFNDDVIDYEALNAATGGFFTVSPIYIGDYAGQTETMTFALNHVGTGTATVDITNVTFYATPEPSAFALLLAASLGLAGAALHRRRRATKR
jgi:autotransporter-associated beta strand protein